MNTRYYKTYLLALTLFSLLIGSCTQDDSLQNDPFVVAFENLSGNLIEMQTEENIQLVYSEKATQNGSVTIQINTENATYGVDFTTIPAAISNSITLPITTGSVENSILFKILNNTLDETTEIEFLITNINYEFSNIQGNKSYLINASAALGGSEKPEVGGPNEGNQAYIDLSSQSTTLVQRDSWDLGFYNGSEFRVTLNGSIYMATKSLTQTNIDAVTEADVSSLQSSVKVGTFNPSNAAYVDNPNGNILETAIAEISANDNDNPVYLLNLGYEVGTAIPTVGSVAVTGTPRGWKKIRILKNGDDYILQYAELNSTTHQEITISKNDNYNFNHFSFNTNTLVNVEPQKEKWDLCFSVFTNIISGAGSYGYSDFTFHNRKGGTVSYRVNTTDFEYENFNLSNVTESEFSKNQTNIGSSWRDVFSGAPYDDRFYILKDGNGNIYKIKFLALTNNNGERGYPEFKYKLLQ